MTKSAYWFSNQKVVSDLGDDDFNLVVKVEPSMEVEEWGENGGVERADLNKPWDTRL